MVSGVMIPASCTICSGGCFVNVPSVTVWVGICPSGRELKHDSQYMGV